MRYREFGEYPQYYSLDEESILDKIDSNSNKKLSVSDLSEREREIARKMIQKDMIKVVVSDSKKYLIVNGKNND